ncbi:hypothetical protein ACQ4PT_007323 [Festuca glaucescens]
MYNISYITGLFPEKQFSDKRTSVYKMIRTLVSPLKNLDQMLDETNNLLRIAIYNISYITGLFPEKQFSDKRTSVCKMTRTLASPLKNLDQMPDEALYNALLMDFVTRAKLQGKLNGGNNQNNVLKFPAARVKSASSSSAPANSKQLPASNKTSYNLRSRAGNSASKKNNWSGSSGAGGDDRKDGNPLNNSNNDPIPHKNQVVLLNIGQLDHYDPSAVDFLLSEEGTVDDRVVLVREAWHRGFHIANTQLLQQAVLRMFLLRGEALQDALDNDPADASYVPSEEECEEAAQEDQAPVIVQNQPQNQDPTDDQGDSEDGDPADEDYVPSEEECEEAAQEDQAPVIVQNQPQNQDPTDDQGDSEDGDPADEDYVPSEEECEEAAQDDQVPVIFQNQELQRQDPRHDQEDSDDEDDEDYVPATEEEEDDDDSENVDFCDASWLYFSSESDSEGEGEDSEYHPPSESENEGADSEYDPSVESD